MTLSNKLLYFITIVNAITIFFHIVNFQIHNMNVNASESSKVEYVIKRSIDNEAKVICYTAFIKNSDNLSISCLPLLKVYNYQKNKDSKIETNKED